jgi:phage minor structural protein
MIRIFQATDKSFGNNGDLVLTASKASIHKEDNGAYYIDIEAPLSNETSSGIVNYNDYLIPNNIIVANTPQGDQAFRITNIEKNRRKIKIRANHVFYDSMNYLIADSYVVDKDCNAALDHLNNATDTLSPFTTISNVTNINSFRCVRKSLYEAIQVVLERWGGHLVRNDWTIGIYNDIGQDNGVTIRYAKNLKTISATYDWNDVVTKILPVGKDGILLNALDEGQSIYIESTVQYDIPYTKTISFEQNNINEDDYKDDEGNIDEERYKQALIDDLYNKAAAYVSENSVPKVNYNLSANVEKVSDVGDRIEVIDEKLGINLMTRIISYDYDCILEKYTNIEFGNFMPKLSDLMSNITASTEQLIQEQNNTLAVTLNRELNDATNKIWDALGNSYVIYEGDKILVVDALPKELARNVIMINNGGIGFSNTGINGTFNSAWTIDNVFNAEQINVINFTADLIKGGTLKLGSSLNQNGQLEVYDEANNLLAVLDKNGLRMNGADGSYVIMNNDVGFAGFDRLDNKIYWVDRDEFHQKKSVAEEEITIVNKIRIIPITITDSNNNIVNDGIGFVNVGGGN